MSNRIITFFFMFLLMIVLPKLAFADTDNVTLNDVLTKLSSHDGNERNLAIGLFKIFSDENESHVERIFLDNMNSKDPEKLDRAR